MATLPCVLLLGHFCVSLSLIAGNLYVVVSLLISFCVEDIPSFTVRIQNARHQAECVG
jgi:hypothetical protein